MELRYRALRGRHHRRPRARARRHWTDALGLDPDKRALYARFDGTKWKPTYLVKTGPKLYPDEEDYTGLGALDPDNPHTIYISTTFDPRDDTTNLGKHEIFAGHDLRQRRDVHVDARHGAVDGGQHPPDRSEVGREPHGAALAAAGRIRARRTTR